MDMKSATRRRWVLAAALALALMQGVPAGRAAALPPTSANTASDQAPSPTKAPVPPIADPKPSAARPLPPGFWLRVTYLPDGFIESKSAQGTAFSLGINASTSREVPGFFRVWMRAISGGKPEFIIAIAEHAGQLDSAIQPAARRNILSDLQMRPGTSISVSSSQGWDIRWTERGVDVRFIVHAPTVAPDNIKRLIAVAECTSRFDCAASRTSAPIGSRWATAA